MRQVITPRAARMSVATGQRSLGDPGQIFPLAPPLLSGCRLTSDAQMQLPLDIDDDYARIDVSLFDQTPHWHRAMGAAAPCRGGAHFHRAEGGHGRRNGARQSHEGVIDHLLPVYRREAI